MNVLILAAGYATRLYPLTLNKAKPLLEVAGKPMIEWVLDNLTVLPDLETIYVVTNSKFPKDFQEWPTNYTNRNPNLDQPGRFIQWLYPRVPVQTYQIKGTWFDIGSKETLEEANKIFSQLVSPQQKR